MDSTQPALVYRPVRAGRRSQGGEPEVKVREPGAWSVHRESHVGLQRLSDHRHQKQTEVRRPWTGVCYLSRPGPKT